MKPRKPITDESFVYRDSASTNIAETFRRERLRLKREAERQAVETEAKRTRTTLKKVSG